MPTPEPLTQESVGRRFKFFPANDETGPRHEQVRFVCGVAAGELLKVCPPGRELSLALTKLEEAMMWGNAAIARGPHVWASAPEQ